MSGNPAPSTLFGGRYLMLEPIGRGAHGAVYRGRDTQCGRAVAIKAIRLSPEGSAKANSATGPFGGADAAVRLRHPGIVAVFDAWEEEGVAYLAMELVEGGDLGSWCAPERMLPLIKVMTIGARVAEALSHAHQRGVVHQDVKPANILWEPAADCVKVTDFGLALVSGFSNRRPGLVEGTPCYLAPEQLSGAEIGPASDLYALGVTLYRLASGRLPFAGGSPTELMYRIAHEPPADILRARPDLPRCLAAVIDQAMRKRPEDRFRDGADLADALRDCASRFAEAAE